MLMPRSNAPRARPSRMKEGVIPAPVGGLNTVSSGSTMPETDCPYAVNLIAAEFGVRTRLGQREWCTGLTGAADNEVRSVLPFTGSAKNGANNKLFACTSSGIWDVSASSASPTKVITFGVTTGEAGWGNSHGFVNSAGHFLLYCDEENGYYVYTETAGTWAKVTLGAGAGQVSAAASTTPAAVDPANFVFVAVFKTRVWFVEKNSARAWYLPLDTILGGGTTLGVKPFEFGRSFKAGGHLVGLWSWTLDAGSGIDDQLVAVSSGGDVAIWNGTDPSSAATFSLKGVWNVGAVPYGRRITTAIGGDMLLLTKTGIRPLSQLVSGGEGQGTYVTGNIANLFNRTMLTKSSLYGWGMYLHPEDASLVVTVPTNNGVGTEQLAMSLVNRSWWPYRSLPMYSAGVWGGKLYFGTVDGQVCINDGYVDGVTLADSSAYTPIQWELLTGFRDLGTGNLKQVQMIRPTFLSEGGEPPFSAEARYNYNMSPLAPVSAGNVGGANAWDSGLWDIATWAGEYAAYGAPRGTSGIGTDVAIALRGQAVARTVLVKLDVAFEMGGWM